MKADLIIQMNRYEPVDITEYAKTQAKEFPLAQSENSTYKKSSHKRCPKASKRADDRVKIKTTGCARDWRRSFRHDDRNYGRKTWIVRYRLRTYG